MEPIAFPSAVAADLHCHTLASTHAYSTVTELAGAAARAGLAALAVTDHGIGLEDSPHLWHFECLKILPPEISGVRILHGVEANVMDMEGRIDMPENLLAGLDIVVASMHGGLTPAEGREACTEAWLRVAANPHVDIIGHSGTPCYAYDYERVIPVFGSHGKVVEINENTFAVPGKLPRKLPPDRPAVQKAPGAGGSRFGRALSRGGWPRAPLPRPPAGHRIPAGTHRQRQPGRLCGLLPGKRHFDISRGARKKIPIT